LIELLLTLAVISSGAGLCLLAYSHIKTGRRLEALEDNVDELVNLGTLSSKAGLNTWIRLAALEMRINEEERNKAATKAE